VGLDRFYRALIVRNTAMLRFRKPFPLLERTLRRLGATRRRETVQRKVWDNSRVTFYQDAMGASEVGTRVRDTTSDVTSLGGLVEVRDKVGHVEYTVAGRRAYGHLFAVMDGHRKRGEGRALLRALETRLRDRGVESIEGGVFMDKVPFYKKCGFAELWPSFVYRQVQKK
jgi:GNAT superfamily N-acetyltransferase